MSETTFPFEGQTVAVAPEQAVVDGGDSSRTKLLLLGGLAAVLVLAVLAYFLVFAGGDDEGDTTAPSKQSAGAPVPAAEPPAAAAPKVKKERLNAKSFGRDPFKALIVEDTESSSPSSVTGGTAGSTAGSTVTAPVASTGDTGTVTGPSAPTTSTPSASTSHRFRVVEVAPDNSAITVKVDGKFYRNLKAGEVFAKFFKVRLISGQANSFQYGEEKFNVLGFKALTIA